ncbi:metallophosphoesterase family protein [Erysipelothrix urinaevulpis]|uniref:metallophosphoesterase family protein n=2 Tax=Erysipelothrix urinaevulpis TaxID=2683717 RepID=UPI0039EE6B47
MIMRFALMSDIHSNVIALNLVLDEISRVHVDAFVFLGDYISDGNNDSKVLDIVSKLGDYIIAGNREKIAEMTFNEEISINQLPLKWTRESLQEDELQFIKTLSTSLRLKVHDQEILLLHGDGVLEDKPFRKSFDWLIDNEVFDICIMGHIHEAFDCSYRGKRFINPGSVGLPADGPGYSYAILDINEENVSVKYYSIDSFDTYNGLRIEYQNSNYFDKHPVWGTLVLDAIRTGKATNVMFFELLNELRKKDEGMSYNQLWNTAFLAYRKIVNSSFDLLSNAQIICYEQRFEEEMMIETSPCLNGKNK